MESDNECLHLSLSLTITLIPGGSSGLGDSTVILISLVVAILVLCLVMLVMTILRRKIRNKRPARRGTMLQKLNTAIGSMHVSLILYI